MKKICIYFFSGTGMTKYVVDKLISEFDIYDMNVDCFCVEDVQISKVDLCNYDLLGIAYPVHAFNAPEIVIKFVKQLPKSHGLNAFVIGTMGENNEINYASSNTLIKKLKRKGYRVFYHRLFEMPCNFIYKYEASKVNLILDNIDKAVPYTAKEIIRHKAHRMRRNPMAGFLNMIGKCEWPGAHIIGKFFYAGNGCTQCGRCVKSCPNHNIVKKGKAVQFKWNCGLCMRCIYQCPTRAIRIRQPFSLIRIDDWYDSDIFAGRRNNRY